MVTMGGHSKMLRKELIIARHLKFLTQKEVADYVGVTQDRISRIESGKSNPTLIQAQILSKFLEIDVNSI
jgi:DNA-binding XRE family transcriptional regulator